MQKALLSILFLPLLLSAQPTVTHIPGHSTKERSIVDLVRDGHTGNLFILYRGEFLAGKFGPTGDTYRYEWDVEVLSPDWKQIHAANTHELKTPKGDKILNGKLVSMHGNACVIFLLYQKKEDKSIVYRAPLGVSGMTETQTEIGSLDGKYMEESQLMYAYSADSSLFMIAQHPSRDKPKEPFSYIVVDEQGKVRRKGNLSIPQQPSDIVVGYPMIANDGTIWAPVWTYDNGLRQEVWIWGANNARTTVVDISPSKERIVTDLQLRQSSYDGYVYAGGTFAAASGEAEKGMFRGKKWNNDPNPEQGTLSLKLDSKSGKVLTRSVQEFSPATLNFWGEKPGVLQKGGALNSLRVVDILPMRDGSTWVGIEQFYQLFQEGTINYTPQAIGSITDGAKYGDPCSLSAIVAHYAPSGEVIQELVIGKRTWSIGNAGIGYFFAAKDQGDLLALYTDHEDNPGKTIVKEENLERTMVGGYGNMKKTACAALFTASPQGKTTSRRLFTQKETGDWLNPDAYVQIAPNSYVFLHLITGNKYGLLRVDW